MIATIVDGPMAGEDVGTLQSDGDWVWCELPATVNKAGDLIAIKESNLRRWISVHGFKLNKDGTREVTHLDGMVETWQCLRNPGAFCCHNAALYRLNYDQGDCQPFMNLDALDDYARVAEAIEPSIKTDYIQPSDVGIDPRRLSVYALVNEWYYKGGKTSNQIRQLFEDYLNNTNPSRRMTPSEDDLSVAAMLEDILGNLEIWDTWYQSSGSGGQDDGGMVHQAL